MSPARLFRLFFLRLLPLMVLGVVCARAMAQADPPSRVARVNFAEGTVVFSPAGDNEWTDAVMNRPLSRGDRVWTDSGSRAEIQVGSSAVRLNGLTHVEILQLDDQAAQLSVTQGSVYVRVRSLPEGENFEVDTPNLAYRVAYPGDYRIDVDAARGTTRVTIHSGTGAVYGEAGQVLPLGGGQQITFRARTLAQMGTQESPPQDNFDRWAADRNRREDQSVSARYVPREVVGYQQLDAHGQWSQDATHGSVWFPQGTPANWAPYRNGHWEWMSPWGWTWIDDAAWGFAPFHYGRWALVGSRWGWVPGRMGLKPVYAPALVAFVGGGSGGVNWNIPLVTGRPGVAWFPLGPGEVWQPGYRASPVYMSNLNQNLTLQANPTYANQRKAEALTSISAEDFHRGKPVRAGWLHIAANTLTSAQIVPPPPMPDHSGVTGRPRTAVARAVPATLAQVQAQAPSQVQAQTQAQAQAIKAVADAASARQAEAAQRETAQRAAQAAAQAKVQAAAQTQAAAQALAQAQVQAKVQAQAQQQADALRVRQAAEQQRALAEQAKLAAAAAKPAVAAPAAVPQAAQAAQVAQAAQARAAEQAKVAAQAKRAEQAQHAAQAKAAEQARYAEQARAEQQAKREKIARRAEQGKREQVAKRAEQAKREQSAKLAEQARREQVAKQAEAKREQAAKHERARLEQVAKREQAKREEHARRADQAKREAVARREEQQRREVHAQHVEQARRAADRDAQALREQRAQREEMQAKRDAQEREQAQQREQAQRATWARQQQALTEQWRRDQQVWEQQQQQQRTRSGRPDLRDDRRSRGSEQPRGIPILNAGPMS